MRLPIVVVLLAACGARSLHLDDDSIWPDGDAFSDGDFCGDEPWIGVVTEDQTLDEVDLLVLVESGNSMREEQANLTANFADLIGALMNPPDDDGDLAPDWNATRSMHIGVISADMGTAGHPITTCDNADVGDDGVLQHLPAAGMAGCDPTYPTFLTFDAEAGDDPVAVASDFSCIATLGTGGCGWKQHLFAVEKAVTVHAADGAANEGFLRNDAVLAIVTVGNNDDCSVADPSIFGDDDSLGPLNLRCFELPELVRPVDEFVDSILSVKPGHPERIVVAAIAGIPPDLVAMSEDQLSAEDIMTAADFEGILNDPRMIETIDYSPEGGGNRLFPSCDVPGLGVTFPPRRIVEFVRDVDAVGNNGMVQSVCQADWTGTVRAVSRVIGRTMRGACLSLQIAGASGAPLATGEHADCALLERLPDDGSCPAGRIDRGLDGGQRVCQVCQQGEGEAPYETDFRGESLAACAGRSAHWFYTTEDPDCAGRGKIEFTDGDEPTSGSILRLECARSALPEPEDC